MASKANWLDRAVLAVAPRAGVKRLQARVMADMLRQFEAARPGRRTNGWGKSRGDANAVNGLGLKALRDLARHLEENNPWAGEALRLISEHTVGDSGIIGIASGRDARSFQDAWNRWADSTDCDADGRTNLAGLQDLSVRTIARDGEVLIRRRVRRVEDGLALPIALQVLEPDFLDETKDGFMGQQGGPVKQGVEFDAIGRRVAYYLFDRHPGSNTAGGLASKRVSADGVIHVFPLLRAGQTRGVSWFAPILARLNNFDTFEDAQLLRQQIAAMFAGFIRDLDGTGSPIGVSDAASPGVESFEPGILQRLGAGEDIVFSNPPMATDDGFSTRTLRSIAAGIGVTYEDLVGDYAQVNFSSGRMGRQKHWAHVRSWQWKMMVPQFCQPVWQWACNAAAFSGVALEAPVARWTAPPPDVLEPDKEGLAAQRMVRAGLRTPSEVVREQGYDPDTFFDEYAHDIEKLRSLGIILDSDASAVTQNGQAQSTGGAQSSGSDNTAE